MAASRVPETMWPVPSEGHSNSYYFPSDGAAYACRELPRGSQMASERRCEVSTPALNRCSYLRSLRASPGLPGTGANLVLDPVR